MNAEESRTGDIDKEVSALIETLHKTEQRLEELTAGEVDTVANGEGRTLLLGRAQDHSRNNESVRQIAILNALPAQIALLDTRGIIVSVNEAWRRSTCASAILGCAHATGINYLEICENDKGVGSADAHKVARGIRSVLGGGIKGFSFEYPCDGRTGQRWFLVTVTPLAHDPPNGVVVMHVDVTADRQAGESLRGSELRFRQMAENIDDVFFLINLDNSQVYYVSPAYEQIWGRTCESLYANPASWADSIHPDDRHYSIKKLSEGRDTGFDYEHRILRPDGEIRWIHVRGFPILDDAGKAYRTAGVASDITERKQASDKLRESERRFSEVLANVEMVSVMLDTGGRITYCNEYLLRLTGWRREEVIGRNWFELFIQPGRSDLKDLFLALLADVPSTRHHENEILTRSGAKRLIQWNNTTLRSAAGEVVGIASIGMDITERKQGEAKLRLQSAALNAAANAMIITERDGEIVWVNPAYTALTGYSDEEALGRNQRDLVKSGVWDTIIAGESWTGEILNRRKDGSHYPEAQTITPVKDDDGAISHFISINTDLTAQREMEAQLRQAQKMEAVGQLAAGVAHEFNNLLQALMSRAAIVRLRAGNAELEKIGADMEIQIKRGARITQQLLVFSRSQPAEKSNLDLRVKVEKASALLRQLIPENIRVVVENSPNRLSFAGDAGQMQQVLLNLAINARDAMPAGGTLTLRAGSQGDEVFMEVEDTGVGMDEATRAHIFEPFFTTKEIGKGTGLGLAVVYGIVEQHGGRIEVTSHPGQGSCFRVVLPTIADAVTPTLETIDHAEPAVGSGRVLLVEDEESVRAGITALLEAVGYEVTAVGSGEEAMDVPPEPAPDLLLTDVTLPGIAGSVLADRLLERWPSMKVVLMSGYLDETANSGDRRWHFLQKPFETTDLVRQLTAALKGQGPAPIGPEDVPDLATLYAVVA